MEVKTIKLKQNEYTNFTEEFNTHDVIFLTGARGAGKSYPVARYVGEYLRLHDTKKFIYLRISNQELHTYAGWANNMNLHMLASSDYYKLTRGRPTAGDITLISYDSDGIEINNRIIGKCVSLESSHNFKSGDFSDFDIIVFEEYIQKQMTPEGEKRYVFNFLENVESIFRKRGKKIFILGNSLKTVPLLERAITELTGELFVNPIKYKIFREGNKSIKNDFLAYLNGELYDDDDFEVKINEFIPIFANKEFIIHMHKIYIIKHYVTRNEHNNKLNYKHENYFILQNFLRRATNEFYYKNNTVEREFIEKYPTVLKEITAFTIDNGYRYLS